MEEKTIKEEKIITMKGSDKINISATAKSYGVCWRTIDRKIHPERYKHSKKKRIYKSILDKYKPIIDAKLENANISATAMYYMLRKKYKYNYSYETIKNYVSKVKKNKINQLTIRFNTMPGYQAQVDWKESLTLHNKNGEEFKVNIFLMVLGYSRFKFIKLTSDRDQKTLFNCMNMAFKYYGGMPKEVLFDNMKTVIDQVKSSFSNVVYNAKFAQYAKDAGFEIFSCRPYRPRTKGKVETLAKIMNRLKAFDYEFDDWEGLEKIVNDLNYDLNYNEKSQATNECPIVKFNKEKEYLNPYNSDLLDTYVQTIKEYKVSNESMIKYKGKKYSVPISYVGKTLSVQESNDVINIYYNKNFICCYNKNDAKSYNYKESDYVDILKNSAYKDMENSEEIAQKSLDDLNNLCDIYIEKKINNKEVKNV